MAERTESYRNEKLGEGKLRSWRSLGEGVGRLEATCLFS